MSAQFTKKVLVLSCCLSFTSSFAAGFESVEHLSTIAKNFVLANVHLDADETIEVKINPGNVPNQLLACDKEIETSFPRNTNMEQINAVEIACTGSRPWQSMVPVYVDVTTKVVAAKQLIAPKTPITSDDLEYISYSKNRLFNGSYKSIDDIIGNIANYTIPAGAIITRKNIKAPSVIHKNQTVNVVSKRNSIIISMQGVAQSDGGMNEMIKVINPSSKKSFDAMVTGSNQVEVAG